MQGHFEEWIFEGSSTEYSFDGSAIYTYLAILVVGGIILCIYLLVYFSMVDVYTYDLKSNRILIGRIIALKNGDNFYLKIGNNLMEKSVTGYYELRFGQEFVEQHRNSLVSIKLGEERIEEFIRPVTFIKERR